jgi:hypothetical protein
VSTTGAHGRCTGHAAPLAVGGNNTKLDSVVIDILHMLQLTVKEPMLHLGAAIPSSVQVGPQFLSGILQRILEQNVNLRLRIRR